MPLKIAAILGVFATIGGGCDPSLRSPERHLIQVSDQVTAAFEKEGLAGIAEVTGDSDSRRIISADGETRIECLVGEGDAPAAVEQRYSGTVRGVSVVCYSWADEGFRKDRAHLGKIAQTLDLRREPS